MLPYTTAAAASVHTVATAVELAAAAAAKQAADALREANERGRYDRTTAGPSHTPGAYAAVALGNPEVGSSVVALTSFAGVEKGQGVAGPAFAPSTTVTALVTRTQPANSPKGALVVPLEGSTTNVVVGMAVSGEGIRDGSVVNHMSNEFVSGKGLVHSITLDRATIAALGEVTLKTAASSTTSALGPFTASPASVAVGPFTQAASALGPFGGSGSALAPFTGGGFGPAPFAIKTVASAPFTAAVDAGSVKAPFAQATGATVTAAEATSVVLSAANPSITLAQTVSGVGIGGGTVVTSYSAATKTITLNQPISRALPPGSTLTFSSPNGPLVFVLSAANAKIAPGQQVTAASGVAAGTTVTAYAAGGNSFVRATSATTAASGVSTLALVASSGVRVGQTVTGAGIRSGTKVLVGNRKFCAWKFTILSSLFEPVTNHMTNSE